MASAEAAAEHERILREIESTETHCIGPTLRSVYDGQEHDEFMEKLDVRIKNHDREIEKMCNYHFQGFVDSITELLKVRGEALKLKSQVTQTDRILQEGASQFRSSMEELQLCRTQQKNINNTIHKLTLCLPVLQMYGRLQEQIKAKRFYPALRTLELLETSSLSQVQQLRFCRVLKETVPSIRTQIQTTAMRQVRDFLESIRRHSERLGDTAVRQRQAQLQRGSAQPRPLIGRRIGRRRENGGEGVMSERDDEEDDEDEVPGAQDLVDFSPVYRCLHIYTALGLHDEFENYYRKQRRKQARLVLQPHANMHETLDGFKSYFNNITGFFVVEDHVLHTTQGLVTRAFVDELWDLALSKITAALRTHSSYCDDPDLILDLKSLIVVFTDTLQGFGFPVSQLFDVLLEMREQYLELLLKRWNAIFRQILDQDNFSPIPVSSEEELNIYRDMFPLRDMDLDQVSFPRKLPFSEFVPKVYSQLKEFIYAVLKYCEDLHLSWTEVDDVIRKSTNLLLTRTLSNCLSYGIRKKNIGLAELVQMIINSAHLEQSCVYLEEFIINISNVPQETTNRLYAVNVFKDVSHLAEAEIYAGLNAKIDQFLQLADYDWLAPVGGAYVVSDYLVDLVAFLRSTFSVFTNLPGKVAQTACMSSCKHISTSLLQMILDPELRQISLGALHQLQTDLEECEGFARSAPVSGFEEDTLLLAFSDIRQLLELFLNWDWSQYLADFGKPSCKYLRVNPQTALTLLEKMRETGKKNLILIQLRKQDRDRHKLIDAVIKQLKNLLQQQ